MAKKRGLKHHIIHKSRLSLLLILKVFLVLLSFSIVVALLLYFSPWIIKQISFLSIIIWGFGLAIAILLYLFLIVRVLDLLNFK